MTAKQAKAATLKRVAPATAVKEIRRLLNEMTGPHGLSNQFMIRDRLERIHDALAKDLDMETWQAMWVGVREGTNDWPKFDL